MLAESGDRAATGGTLTIDSDDPDSPVITIGLSCDGITSLDRGDARARIVMTTTPVGVPVSQTVMLKKAGSGSDTVV